MNGLHPCTLPRQALFTAVSRVLPLCAAFRPDCECVRGATGKANVAPTCEKTKSQSSNAIAILRGGTAEWMSFRARAEAKDMELVPTKEPASHLASRRTPGSLPNAVCGQKPTPTSTETEETCKKTNNSAFGFQHRIWKRYAEKQHRPI